MPNTKPRKPIIAGNWKMYKTAGEAVAFASAFSELIAGYKDVEAVVCPPFTALEALSRFAGAGFALGAQNMHSEPEGAYTGEVSAAMLLELGVKYVIVGHSERRQYFAETNQSVNKKVRAAFAAGLLPIMCVGESLEQRQKGETQALLQDQVRQGLHNVEAADLSKLVIAYEPIWAIGTGQTATPQDANDAIRHIRAVVGSLAGPEVAAGVRIQYGGSVKPDNIATLMNEPDIDGALVGGASLDPASFAAIVKYR